MSYDGGDLCHRGWYDSYITAHKYVQFCTAPRRYNRQLSPTLVLAAPASMSSSWRPVKYCRVVSKLSCPRNSRRNSRFMPLRSRSTAHVCRNRCGCNRGTSALLPSRSSMCRNEVRSRGYPLTVTNTGLTPMRLHAGRSVLR